MVYQGGLLQFIRAPDAFKNNMTTGAHCEGANNKCKDKTITQDNGCLLFYHALGKSGSKQVAECPLESFLYINENVKNGNFEKYLKICLSN